MTTTIDLAEPSDVDAERAVLSAVLLDHHVLADLTLSADDFYDPRHADIWQEMGRLDRAHEPLDPITLSARLPERARTYLVDLVSAAPSSAAGPYYARIVADKALLRRLSRAATRIVQATHTITADPADIAQDARAEIDKAILDARQGTLEPLPEAIARTIEAIRHPVTDIVSTPWPELHRRLAGGLRPGNLYVLGGRPGDGKSLMAEQLCTHVARTTGRGVLLASLEMSQIEVHLRMLAAASSINLGKLHEGNLDLCEWADLDTALSTLDIPVTIDDTPALKVVDVRARARTLTRTADGLALIVVDYLQLMSASPQRNREREVADISRSLKILARELDVPVVATAQVSRGPMLRGSHRPTMYDLRESGAIEADADVVLLLYRPTDDDERPRDDVEVVIAKNRHGPTGRIVLDWQGHYARIMSRSRT
jgi:replicative DNA helicase